MDFTPAEFRQALGVFPTGVAVVTARAPDGLLQGMTVSSFNGACGAAGLVVANGEAAGEGGAVIVNFNAAIAALVPVCMGRRSDRAAEFSGNRHRFVRSSRHGRGLLPGPRDSLSPRDRA